VSEPESGHTAAFAEGWHTDPFGRHESRFHDGARWTPYVKDGEDHALDEPVEGHDLDIPVPEILTAKVLVVELHVDLDNRTTAYSVFGKDGRDLGAVRPAAIEDHRYDVVAGDGQVALSLVKSTSMRRSVVGVRDARGADMGRVVEQHLPGTTAFALESSAGGNVGFVRARTWAGWDVRVEDDRNRPVARVSKLWDGLDRAAYPTPDNYVVRIERELLDPQRSLVYAAVLCVDSLLKRDTRGFA